ncbi:MAG: 50S ribosomal protein L11 methyltransferase [Caldilineaceae bacterium]|nr:50S ribosomal protein L11 methyltransferase [Caldilineaceae bacterium]MCB0097035.1 50S ribosomal protein L11 methyltransferase [Caldilineaceae bacterium]MCB0140377.1 50S ribosomal protein L11 methyltransferase [Caldilineaceae bacterium]MCB9157293.1 50S ribosomal protein L11 methyltransferase [Caldilineaceae bacterium]
MAESKSDELIELSVVVDSEAAEAVSELFNRYNGGSYHEDNEAGEAGGGGAVIEATGFDDFNRPIDGEYRLSVKTYIKPGKRGQQIQRQIEEGLWRLSLIYPMPEPQIRAIRQEDWATAWKKFYKPLRVGQRVLLKPSWEEATTEPDDIVIELEPGMAFGTGMHPTTRLCVAALEEIVQPGDAVLDVGTGSGILAVLAAKLGASPIVATDIDTIAVQVGRENMALNGLAHRLDNDITILHDSVPTHVAGQFPVVVANILAEVIVKLFDGSYGNTPLAEPLAAGGHMILSGILDEKADMVLEAAQRHGLRFVDRKTEGDWVALIVRKVAE